MAKEGYVAFDLGAESGRAMLAVLDGGKLKLTEAHRFPNIPVRMPSGLHWNLTELWQNLVTGLKHAGELATRQKVKLVSLGVDTWGVDYGLVGKSGQLIGLPFAYRDDRNPPAMKRVMNKLGAKKIYDVTGIQFMPFNTLYQLAAEAKAEPAVLAQAKHLLLMPDLLHYFFSGKAVVEETIASTTQMIDPRSKHGTWAKAMLNDAGLPTQLLGKIVPAGTTIGTLREEIAREAGVEAIKVIVPGSHDTASAVAAVPVDMSRKQRWAYLSSGTWSLMGAELDKPLINDATHKASFTNERGVGGKIRFLKNIAGLWLVQECRRDYERKGKAYNYQQLTDLAAKAKPFRTLVDPGHGPFATPDDMLAKIDAFAKATGQPKPSSPGEYVRCCLESLALTYRQTLTQLEDLLGEPFDVLHIVGGGGQNRLLNQMTADAIGKPVIVGPFEATAIGNALTQALGHGKVKDLADLRKIVRASTDLLEYKPLASDTYNEQMPRYQSVLGK